MIRKTRGHSVIHAFLQDAYRTHLRTYVGFGGVVLEKPLKIGISSKPHPSEHLPRLEHLNDITSCLLCLDLLDVKAHVTLSFIYATVFPLLSRYFI